MARQRINHERMAAAMQQARPKYEGMFYFLRNLTTKRFEQRQTAGHHPEFRSLFLNDDTGFTSTIYGGGYGGPGNAVTGSKGGCPEFEFGGTDEVALKALADAFDARFPGDYSDADCQTFLRENGFEGFMKPSGW